MRTVKQPFAPDFPPRLSCKLQCSSKFQATSCESFQIEAISCASAVALELTGAGVCRR
jgi:hypothetical protein